MSKTCDGAVIVSDFMAIISWPHDLLVICNWGFSFPSLLTTQRLIARQHFLVLPLFQPFRYNSTSSFVLKTIDHFLCFLQIKYYQQTLISITLLMNLNSRSVSFGFSLWCLFHFFYDERIMVKDCICLPSYLNHVSLCWSSAVIGLTWFL